jgi:hypothetical protein
MIMITPQVCDQRGRRNRFLYATSTNMSWAAGVKIPLKSDCCMAQPRLTVSRGISDTGAGWPGPRNVGGPSLIGSRLMKGHNCRLVENPHVESFLSGHQVTVTCSRCRCPMRCFFAGSKATGVAVLLVELYLAASLIGCFQLQMRMGLQDAMNRDDEVAARRRCRDNGTT